MLLAACTVGPDYVRPTCWRSTSSRIRASVADRASGDALRSTWNSGAASATRCSSSSWTKPCFPTTTCASPWRTTNKPTLCCAIPSSTSSDFHPVALRESQRRAQQQRPAAGRVDSAGARQRTQYSAGISAAVGVGFLSGRIAPRYRGAAAPRPASQCEPIWPLRRWCW